MLTLVLATTNEHKLEEYNHILNRNNITVISFKDLGLKLPEVKEDGKTFSENALIKAIAAAKLINLPVIADDSGLCVEAIEDFPGILSARFARECGDFKKANSEIVKRTPLDNRKAHFTCAIALVNYFPEPKVVEAQVSGQIRKYYTNEISFGYDPIFIPDGFDTTYHKLEKMVKNKVSHRAKACEKLVELINTKK